MSISEILTIIGMVIALISSLCGLVYWFNTRLSDITQKVALLESNQLSDIKRVEMTEDNLSKELTKIESSIKEVSTGIQELKINLAQANFNAINIRLDRLENHINSSLSEFRKEFVSIGQCRQFRSKSEEGC